MDGKATQDQHVWSLLLDEACRRVVAQLRAADQPFLVLKGATIATWLYENPTARTYSDFDVLVPPGDADRVVDLLRDLGFRPLLDRAALEVISPDEQPLQNRHGVTIDLHVAIQGLEAPPDQAWTVLHDRSVPWDWAGTTVPALDETDRAMLLPVHLAKRGTEDLKAVHDLELGLDQLDEGVWRAAAGRARELQALEAFTAGLVLVPRGLELAERLGLPRPSDTAVLMSSDASVFRPAVALERILSTESWPQRLRTIRAYLFPSATWLRHTDPRAGEGRWGLTVARVRRPFRTLARLAAAERERRRFRRRSAS